MRSTEDFDEQWEVARSRINQTRQAVRQALIDKMDPNAVIDTHEVHVRCDELTRLFVKIARNRLRAEPDTRQSVRSHGERIQTLVLRCDVYFNLNTQSRRVVQNILKDGDTDIVRATCRLYNLVADATRGIKWPSLLDLIARAAE